MTYGRLSNLSWPSARKQRSELIPNSVGLLVASIYVQMVMLDTLRRS